MQEMIHKTHDTGSINTTHNTLETPAETQAWPKRHDNPKRDNNINLITHNKQAQIEEEEEKEKAAEPEEDDSGGETQDDILC